MRAVIGSGHHAAREPKGAVSECRSRSNYVDTVLIPCLLAPTFGLVLFSVKCFCNRFDSKSRAVRRSGPLAGKERSFGFSHGFMRVRP
jgi:hypothetical protein